MQRINITPRKNWESKIQEQGLLYYKDYYKEDAAYEFTSAEVDNIEKATQDILEMCLGVVQHVVENNLFREFFIPEKFAEIIKRSWNEDFISLYGRFDLGYNGSDIKLLEFNSDTPTGLVESSIVQWYWLQDYNSRFDQFNSIHEKLVDHMKVCKPYLAGDKKLHFSCIQNHPEDFMNTKYLQECANQASIDNGFLFIEDISMDSENRFVDLLGNKLSNIFKLYPYEWMFNEEFGDYLISNVDETTWIEPFYKAILSNKMLLKYLYDLYPNSPYLLKCEFGKPITENYVKKPIYSREGANIDIVVGGKTIEQTTGDYGEEGFIFQEYFELPKFDRNIPILGSWLIGGESAGMVIRESKNLVTNNMSYFTPHYFTK